MTFALTTPVAGALATGFTAPTYTLTADSPPANNGKQWAVTALGGTQAGVIPHTVAAPFTISMFKPLLFKFLQPVNAITGVLKNVPMNVYKVITRKGVLPLAGQAYKNMVITTSIEVPAGADTADGPNIQAAISAHIGALAQQSAGIGDTTKSGIL